ncbi:MAG: DUF3667 domain-containing protein [Pseudomonadales bacterium]|jgi:hypothetical protein|nr:DUF3667 domain-containing protein [Pseudomonadales bacterium]
MTAAYCANCGQRQTPSIVPVGDWFGDLVEGLFGADAVLPRTLATLLLRPGELTRRYAEGRRASQSGPLRVYIVVSAAVIGLMTTFNAFSSFGDLDPGVLTVFPLVNLLSPLFLGGLLKIAFPRRLTMLHLVFGTHFATIMVIVTTPTIFLDDPLMLTASLGVLSLLLMAHLAAAMRHVYGCGWLRAGTSAVGVYVVLTLFLQLALGGLLRAFSA